MIFSQKNNKAEELRACLLNHVKKPLVRLTDEPFVWDVLHLNFINNTRFKEQTNPKKSKEGSSLSPFRESFTEIPSAKQSHLLIRIILAFAPGVGGRLRLWGWEGCHGNHVLKGNASTLKSNVLGEPGASYTGLLGHDEGEMLTEAWLKGYYVHLAENPTRKKEWHS